MKKLYFILILVVMSFVMVFAGDTIKMLRIYHNDAYTDIPISRIVSVDHSKYDTDGVLQSDYTTSIVWTSDNEYAFPIADIDSVTVTETVLEGEELYEKVANELHDYIFSHENATIKDIQLLLEKYSTSVSTEVRNGILYVQIDNNYEYMCDLYRVTCPDIYGDNDFDDNYVERMLADIYEALYSDRARANVRSQNSIPTSMSIGVSTRASVSDDEVCLNKKNFYVWSPWPVSTVSTTDPSAVKGSTLSDLRKVKDYSIALLVCHGSEKGCISVPNNDEYMSELNGEHLEEGKNNDYHKGIVGKGSSAVEALILHKSAMEKFLTGDLSKTIIWTAMCFANVNGSELKSVAQSKGNAAYAGANNMYYLEGGLGQNGAKTFVEQFYSVSRYAEHFVKDGFQASSERSPISKRYTISYSEDNVVKTVSGEYSFEYNKHFFYEPMVENMNAIENQPRASVTMPYELFAEYHLANATRQNISTRGSSVGNISAGFWIRNIKTKEETEIEFKELPVKEYENEDNPRFYPKDNSKPKEIVRIEVLGKTVDLDDGTYEYRTYLNIDGKKSYSEDIYEFIKESITMDEITKRTDDGNPILTGKINVYEDLDKEELKFFAFCHEGTDNFTPEDDDVTKIEIPVEKIHNDGTFEFDFQSEDPLKSAIVYGFSFGFEYNGKTYYGETKLYGKFDGLEYEKKEEWCSILSGEATVLYSYEITTHFEATKNQKVFGLALYSGDELLATKPVKVVEGNNTQVTTFEFGCTRDDFVFDYTNFKAKVDNLYLAAVTNVTINGELTGVVFNDPKDMVKFEITYEQKPDVRFTNVEVQKAEFAGDDALIGYIVQANSTGTLFIESVRLVTEGDNWQIVTHDPITDLLSDNGLVSDYGILRIYDYKDLNNPKSLSSLFGYFEIKGPQLNTTSSNHFQFTSSNGKYITGAKIIEGKRSVSATRSLPKESNCIAIEMGTTSDKLTLQDGLSTLRKENMIPERWFNVPILQKNKGKSKDIFLRRMRH